MQRVRSVRQLQGQSESPARAEAAAGALVVQADARHSRCRAADCVYVRCVFVRACGMRLSVQVVGGGDDDSDEDKEVEAKQRQLAEQKRKESIMLHMRILLHAMGCNPGPEAPCNIMLCVKMKVRGGPSSMPPLWYLRRVTRAGVVCHGVRRRSLQTIPMFAQCVPVAAAHSV